MWWLVIPVVVATLEPVLADLVAYLRERRAARLCGDCTRHARRRLKAAARRRR